MDLATAQKPRVTSWRRLITVIHILCLLPGVGLAVWVFLRQTALGPLRLSAAERLTLLGEWKLYRNLGYAGFMLLFILVGVLVLVQQLSARMGKQTAAASIVTPAVIGLLLLTFSYALGALLVDLSLVAGWMVRGR